MPGRARREHPAIVASSGRCRGSVMAGLTRMSRSEAADLARGRTQYPPHAVREHGDPDGNVRDVLHDQRHAPDADDAGLERRSRLLLRRTVSASAHRGRRASALLGVGALVLGTAPSKGTPFFSVMTRSPPSLQTPAMVLPSSLCPCALPGAMVVVASPL